MTQAQDPKQKKLNMDQWKPKSGSQNLKNSFRKRGWKSKTAIEKLKNNKTIWKELSRLQQLHFQSKCQSQVQAFSSYGTDRHIWRVLCKKKRSDDGDAFTVGRGRFSSTRTVIYLPLGYQQLLLGYPRVSFRMWSLCARGYSNQW